MKTLKAAKEFFISLIKSQDENEGESKTTQNFWNTNKKKLPNLFKVACFTYFTSIKCFY